MKPSAHGKKVHGERGQIEIAGTTVSAGWIRLEQVVFEPAGQDVYVYNMLVGQY